METSFISKVTINNLFTATEAGACYANAFVIACAVDASHLGCMVMVMLVMGKGIPNDVPNDTPNGVPKDMPKNISNDMLSAL
jgi:hypothetical protein